MFSRRVLWDALGFTLGPLRCLDKRQIGVDCNLYSRFLRTFITVFVSSGENDFSWKLDLAVVAALTADMGHLLKDDVVNWFNCCFTLIVRHSVLSMTSVRMVMMMSVMVLMMMDILGFTLRGLSAFEKHLIAFQFWCLISGGYLHRVTHLINICKVYWIIKF